MGINLGRRERNVDGEVGSGEFRWSSGEQVARYRKRWACPDTGAGGVGWYPVPERGGPGVSGTGEGVCRVAPARSCPVSESGPEGAQGVARAVLPVCGLEAAMGTGDGGSHVVAGCLRGGVGRTPRNGQTRVRGSRY